MPDPKAQRHLVGVWNPSYGADVMESHIMLLGQRAKPWRASEGLRGRGDLGAIKKRV